jgi:hypothetical protein
MRMRHSAWPLLIVAGCSLPLAGTGAEMLDDSGVDGDAPSDGEGPRPADAAGRVTAPYDSGVDGAALDAAQSSDGAGADAVTDAPGPPDPGDDAGDPGGPGRGPGKGH